MRLLIKDKHSTVLNPSKVIGITACFTVYPVSEPIPNKGKSQLVKLLHHDKSQRSIFYQYISHN